MIRPMTCLSLIAALGAGLYLYQEKHTAQLLDREINRTIKQTDQARERTGLLRAEWALLNEPERLQGLANDHLQLQSLAPAQFARLEDLPNRLPAISAMPVNVAPVQDVPLPILRSVTPAPAPIAQLVPAPTSAAPSFVAQSFANQSVPAQLGASVQPARPLPPLQLATARPAPAPKPAAPHVLAAAAKPKDADPAPVVAAATVQPAVPAPRPYFAPVMPAYAPTPVIIHAPTVQTASAIQQSPSPFVGSALGMARTMLAAPVPVASAASMGYASGR